jgi:hypothetical protein
MQCVRTKYLFCVPILNIKFCGWVTAVSGWRVCARVWCGVRTPIFWTMQSTRCSCDWANDPFRCSSSLQHTPIRSWCNLQLHGECVLHSNRATIKQLTKGRVIGQKAADAFFSHAAEEKDRRRHNQSQTFAAAVSCFATFDRMIRVAYYTRR